MVRMIVSGGQTGADRAALDVAIHHGLPHGGWCPAGRRAEDGAIGVEYDLIETPSRDYLQRTEWNVRDSDGTAVFTLGLKATGGSLRTIGFARQLRKPWVHVSRETLDPKRDFVSFLERHRIQRLNVAGSRESTNPGIYRWVTELLEETIFGIGASGINRAEASRIGAAEITAKALGSGAREALLLEELGSQPPSLYRGPDLARCWIVYAMRQDFGIRSSTVVLISRATGEVLYSGSAHDEG